MQRLEVSGAERPPYGSLSVKGLRYSSTECYSLIYVEVYHDMSFHQIFRLKICI